MKSQSKEFSEILSSVTEFIQVDQPTSVAKPVQPTIMEEIQNTAFERIETDFEMMRQICVKHSIEFIENLVKFYLDGEILNDPYIQKRMKDDAETIADLKNQMETSQYAITKLLKVIEGGGEFAPRNFEVLSMLQKSKMEIVKHYEAVKTNIENNYRHFKTVYDQTHAEEHEALEINSGYGTKALLDNLELNLDAALLDTTPDSDDLSDDDFVEEKIQLPKGVKFYDPTDPTED